MAERMEPEEEPRDSISLTIFMDSASATSPKTTCLPSSQEVTTVVMKNWDPLLDKIREKDVSAVHEIDKERVQRTCWDQRWPLRADRGGRACR